MATRTLSSGRAAIEEPRPALRSLIAPLTVILTLTTAVALFLVVATMIPPPLPESIAVRPSTAATAFITLDAERTVLIRSERAVLPQAPMVIGLARLIYRAGAAGSSRALQGPLLLAVESGVLTAHVDGSGDRFRANGITEPANGDLLLHAGDSLSLPAAAAASFRNDGASPAVALAAGVFPTSAQLGGAGRMATTRWDDDWTPGATVQELAGGWAIDLAAGPATGAHQRVNLRPGDGTTLAASGVAAIAVDAGALTMTAGEGLVWLQHPDGSDEWLSPGAAATLLPRNGALLQSGTQATIRNDGSAPLLAVVLSVAPAATDATTPATG
jgi:hypothetical protein